MLAGRGITVVYGGGHVGLMGLLAEAALKAGGQVIGVIPEGLKRRELAYDNLTELIVTRTMHERKQRMADLADGFIALPGGFGTFEEFCEIVTWAQLGLHQKPCGLLNVKGYYDPMLSMFDHGVRTVSGTDGGIGSGKGHGISANAIGMLVQGGIPNAAALASATSQAAKACGVSKGVLKPGWDADIIAVQGDPMRDITALERVTTVVIGGQIVMTTLPAD